MKLLSSFLCLLLFPLCALAEEDKASKAVFSSNGVAIDVYGGIFIYTNDNTDFEYYWESDAKSVGGWLAYGIRPDALIGIEISRFSNNSNLSITGSFVDAKNNVFSLLMSYRHALTQYDRPRVLYGVAGIGFSRLDVDVEIMRAFRPSLNLSESWTNFAYQAGFGLCLGQFITVEGVYFTGHRKGNTGLRLNVGLAIKFAELV